MIYDNILAEIKEAMKAKNTDKKDVLKQVQIKVQAISKEEKKEITDEIVLNAINKELKQLNQTLEAIKSKPDSELYKSTLIKIDTLKVYLPAQLSTEEIESEISKIISSNSAEPKGKLTGIVMKTLKGKADNKTIKEVLDRLLK